ncbi:metal-dependent hydrolase [Nocardia sp. NBC_01377]|uniref:metal-dependent hydrolase n=1 Tax=Nocardia sp. NBC_01377 TaxID=2903595 RepID=UPI003246BF0B
MTDLEVRRPKFDFTEDVPWEWNPGNPSFSFSMNATSFIAICFEQMIVAAVQEAKPLLGDPDVAAEALAFLRQEAQHSSSHRKHVGALCKRYPGLAQTLDKAIASYDSLAANTSLKYRLAYIANLEATFTPSMKLMLDNEDTLFRPGDDRVASLFLWHFVEEVEHRSSAMVIYNEAYGDTWFRMKSIPSVVKHLIEVMGIIADGVNEHVPESDRKIDARTRLAVGEAEPSLWDRLPFGTKKPSSIAPPGFATVSWREKFVAAARVLMSQTPFHNPAHAVLPKFADCWFERWDKGEDVTRWYSAQIAS